MIPKTIAIVAGEHSGDNHGAELIKSLKVKYPDAKFIGIGADKMLSAGLKSLYPIDKLSVIGVFNVIKKLPELIRLRNNLVKQLVNNNIDLYIGIDAPDFNLSVANRLKKIIEKNNLNMKIIQYISPTVWAWRPRRIYKIAKATDIVLCLFPFEQDIYNKENISAKFVGHPLAETLSLRTDIDKTADLEKIRQICESPDYFININLDINLDKNLDKNLISIFPGSRAGEIKSLGKIFLAAAHKLYTQDNNISFLVPIVSEKMFNIWQKVYENYFSDNSWDERQLADLYLMPEFKSNINIIKLYNTNISSHTVMRASDLILCASGTTTLEAFLIGVPMVVAYKVSKLNELLFRLLIKVKYIAMPNILSDMIYKTQIVPEFVQNNVTADNLYHAINSELNTDSNNSSNLKKIKTDLINYLKSPDNVTHNQAVIAAVENIINN